MCQIRKAIFLTTVTVSFAACSSIDCPLNNKVYATYKFAGTVTTLRDTLTVSTPLSEAEGSDTVLVNRVVNTDSITLPMSYARTEDTFYFRFANAEGVVTIDTIQVAKQNQPHFESVDCNPAMFHTITDVKYTHNAIETIEINNNTVTYNAAKAHFLIYLKSSDD